MTRGKLKKMRQYLGVNASTIYARFSKVITPLRLICLKRGDASGGILEPGSARIVGVLALIGRTFAQR